MATEGFQQDRRHPLYAPHNDVNRKTVMEVWYSQVSVLVEVGEHSMKAKVPRISAKYAPSSDISWIQVIKK